VFAGRHSETCERNIVLAKGRPQIQPKPERGEKVKKRLLRLSSVAVLLIASAALNAEQPEWVGTWASSPMQVQVDAMKDLVGATLREIVHVSAGGEKVRIRFTNEFGTDSLAITDAHIAISAGGGKIKGGTDRKLTFGGESSVHIAPGAALYSDPVDLAVLPLSDVAISFFLPDQFMRAGTQHALGLQTNYVAQGDVSGEAKLSDSKKLNSWYFVSGVEVPAQKNSRAIVTLGDSITDGARSTPDTNRRWPDVLAERLQNSKAFQDVSVLNEGISGNRVLNEGAGPSALSRLDRDVLAQEGVKYLIVLESINDIGRIARPHKPEEDITAGQLENVLSQIAATAHGHGIKVYGATLTPYIGAGYASEKGEQIRNAVNNWIRTSGVFDAVIDFEKITGDGAKPPKFNPAFDAGDHLHPSDAGYKAMGEAIDLNLFK
jgi:lysophospholipase L1-like esterase